jgi:ABC-2 type transport system permease protein
MFPFPLIALLGVPGSPMPAAPARRGPSAWVQFRAVFRKEVLQTLSDRRVMFLIVVAPLIQTMVFGFAVDFDVDRVPTVVVDPDRSSESRSDLRRLLADGTLTEIARVPDLSQAGKALETGEAAAILVLPSGFERDRLAGRPSTAQVVVDGTDPNRSGVVAGAVGRYFAERSQRLVETELARVGRTPPQLEVVPRLYYNPSLRTAPYTIPGVLGMLLLIVTTIVTAMGLSRERETGTLEQVLVTPIRPLFLLLGKMAPFVLVGLIDVALVLTGGAYVFAMPLRGSLWLVAVASLLYLLSTLGVGLLIATFSKSQQQAFLGGFLFALPAILLSGVMTPIGAMPEWLANVTLLNPVRYFVEIMRGVLLKDASVSDLVLQFTVLVLFGVALLTVSAQRFRRQLN